MKNHCQYTFKDTRCNYKGEATGCAKTFRACLKLGNGANFRSDLMIPATVKPKPTLRLVINNTPRNKQQPESETLLSP